MKKYLLFIMLLFFFCPINIKAIEGIDNFYIDATVLNNGDIKVREVFVMNGSYNGMERIINYKNILAQEFDPNKDYYGGSSIHNGSGITIDEVGAIDIYNNYGYEIINKKIDVFKYNKNASKGDYGYYYNDDASNGTTLMIFNPSRKNKAFYVEYTLSNMGIKHNDIAEIGWNLFDEMREYINHFEMYIHIPNNQNELRVWAHGPLQGVSEIIDKNTVKVSVDNLSAYTAIDVRLTFDLQVIANSNKTTNVNALDKIIYYEQNQAEIANQEREEAQKLLLKEATRLVEKAEKNKTRSSYNDAQNYLDFYILSGEEKQALQKRLDAVLKIVEERENREKNILYGIWGIWLIGLIYVIYDKYRKDDKEYKANFSGKYYRDFPNNYGPEIVEYLFKKKIDSNGLTSAILNLIADKVITLESEGKKHTLIYNQKGRNLKESDQELLNWLFVKVGDNNRVTLDEFKDSGKKYESFLDYYNSWKHAAEKEGESYNFYEENKKIFDFNGIYAAFGFIIGLILLIRFMDTETILFFFFSLILSSCVLLYFGLMKKRTRLANEEYAKWKGLKNFISDFGRFQERDLPDIHLWEKYLVYAHVFGLSKKLAKTMQIKIKDMNYDNVVVGDFTDTLIHINLMSNINQAIDSSVAKAMSTANTAYAAAHSSSGSGGGGGFSSGGGSFGGGGGGGRF